MEGRAIVAYWLILCGMLTVARLIARSGDIVGHSVAWRAGAGPFVVALLSFLAAWRLLRGRRNIRLAAALLSVQLVALSAGPLAYRLDAGPFLRFGLSETGMHANAGSDARLLLIVGARNHVPSGIAVNVLALIGLMILLSAHRAAVTEHRPRDL